MAADEAEHRSGGPAEEPAAESDSPQTAAEEGEPAADAQAPPHAAEDGRTKRRFRFRIVTRGAIIRLSIAALIVVLCVFLAPETWLGRVPRIV